MSLGAATGPPKDSIMAERGSYWSWLFISAGYPQKVVGKGAPHMIDRTRYVGGSTVVRGWSGGGSVCYPPLRSVV